MKLKNSVMSTVSSHCILVVDDEPMIRRLVRTLLENSGFAVLDAGNGNDALTLFHAHRDTISLVLTDVLMPHMNGATLVNHLRKIDATVPILFISAYCDTLRGAMSNIECLPKPFTPDELVHKVQYALRNHAGIAAAQQ
ncbi:MAG: sensor hybrid histidine kinase [Bryobacterales bacterium]|nr:sensor hybrid histidine kinase [Bryobacterales bacterium]